MENPPDWLVELDAVDVDVELDAVDVDVVLVEDVLCSVPLVCVVDDVVLVGVDDAPDEAGVSAGVALPSILSITVLASLIIFCTTL